MDKDKFRWTVWYDGVVQGAFDQADLAEEYMDMQQKKYSNLTFELRDSQAPKLKEKEWKPELGEEVEAHDPPDSEWEGRQGTIIAFGVNNNGLLFNPCWTDGKSGWEGTHIIEGYPCVPGYPKSHMGFALSHLRPVRKCKK